jgi:hypothetical protein
MRSPFSHTSFFANIPRRLIPVFLSILALIMIIPPVANRIAASVILSRLEDALEPSSLDVQLDNFRIRLFRGRVRSETIILSGEDGEIAAVEGFSMSMRFLRAYRSYRDGLLPDISGLGPRNLPALWAAAEAAVSAGFMPRRLSIAALRYGGFSGGIFISSRRGIIDFTGDLSGSQYGLAFAGNFSGVASISSRSLEADLALEFPEDLDAAIAIQAVDSGTRLLLSGAVNGPLPLIAELAHWDLSMDFEGILDPSYRLAGSRPEIAAYPEPAAPLGIIRIETGNIEVNGVRAGFSADIEGLVQADEGPAGLRSPMLPETIRLRLDAEAVDIQDALSLFPPEILGDLSAAEVSGTVSGRADVIIPPGYLRGIEWDPRLEVRGFSLLNMPRQYDPRALMDGFEHTIQDTGIEYSRKIRIPAYQQPSMEWMLLHSERSRAWIESHWAGIPASEVASDGNGILAENLPDDSYVYVRLEDMSRWIISAILTGEDGDFFFHRGVDWNTVSDAIARNVSEGEIILGASTISMQLVKNLFLSDDREFSRKFQELLLVYLVEEQLGIPKDRILEIYINLAEFGPGIFGIYDAARHYFGKNPADLSAGEAVWLASILPSPKRYYQYYRNGAISPGWFERMRWNFDTMLERGRMTEAEYAAATAAIPRFYYPDPADGPGE